jgi:hypothetical protein
VVHYRGRTIYLEMKSPVGTLSKTQHQVRLELLTSGADWWLARSANGAMIALAKSGVVFLTTTHADGTIERWEAPELPAWEEPVQSPFQPHPSHPELTARRREAKRRQRATTRERQRRAREIPQPLGDQERMEAAQTRPRKVKQQNEASAWNAAVLYLPSARRPGSGAAAGKVLCPAVRPLM